MDIALLVLGSMLGGALMVGLGLLAAMALARIGGIEAFPAFAISLWWMGPAFFGVGTAFTYYVWRWREGRDPQWQASVVLTGGVLLLLFVVQGFLVWREK